MKHNAHYAEFIGEVFELAARIQPLRQRNGSHAFPFAEIGARFAQLRPSIFPGKSVVLDRACCLQNG